jgi:4-oxalocrotonate tautomerase
MPHVTVKLWPGKSEEQKARLAERITEDVMAVLNYGEESVSVSIEEVEPQDWTEKVHKPDILDNPQRLYKEPGYHPRSKVLFPSGQCSKADDGGDA